MKKNVEINLKNRVIGPGHPAFIIAEMSGNHGGKLERALEIVHAAHRAGADCIKLQTYRGDTITLKSDREDFQLLSDSPWHKHKTLYDLYEEAQTPWEWHAPLFAEARKLGMEVFSSPFDETAVDLLESLDVQLYKIASPEITHIPLLRKVASTKKPVIVSTGVADLEDIELALKTLRDAGSGPISLLKCTTSYPAPIEESNLRTIPDFLERFAVVPGLSDHTLGYEIPMAAVAAGACIVEKHIILDNSPETVDSFFSLAETEFKKMIEAIRRIESALGKVDYEIPPSARSSIRGRRSLYVSQPIKKGEIVTAESIKCVRPSMGLHPKYYWEVLGKMATVDLIPGDRLDLKTLLAVNET